MPVNSVGNGTFHISSILGLPDFGFHPHFGLIANTIVIEGSFYDEDNLNGRSE